MLVMGNTIDAIDAQYFYFTLRVCSQCIFLSSLLHLQGSTNEVSFANLVLLLST